MARMLWLKLAAGTSLAMSVGCHGPNGPSRTTIVTPPATFPSPSAPGGQPMKTPPPNGAAMNTPVTTPGINDSKLRIGSPAAQATPKANPSIAKLRPVEAPQGGAVPATESLPPRSDNGFRNLASGEFDKEWNLGKAPIAPFGGSRLDGNVAAASSVGPGNSIAPPPPMTSLPPNMLPAGNLPPYPSTGASMPTASSGALPMPQFPAQPAFPSASFQPPPNPANNFPTANTPSAPNLSPQSSARPNIYPSGNP